MFHHLERSQKQGMLREVHRVLKPGGRFLMADFGGTSSALHRLRDSAEERVLAAMKEAELVDARVAGTRSLLAGLLLVVHYEAVCP
jgi:ubiquinone/menaquinone biosynthesis C-methylase UbiE